MIYVSLACSRIDSCRLQSLVIALCVVTSVGCWQSASSLLKVAPEDLNLGELYEGVDELKAAGLLEMGPVVADARASSEREPPDDDEGEDGEGDAVGLGPDA